jgi:hypothetical protein
MYTSIYNIVIICADRPRIINDVENKRLYINIYIYIYIIHTYYIFIVIFFLARFVSSAAANLTPRRVRTLKKKKKSLPYLSNTTRRSNDYCCYYYYYFTQNDVYLRHRHIYLHIIYRQCYIICDVCANSELHVFRRE